MNFILVLCLFITVAVTSPTPRVFPTELIKKHPAVQNFREYLRIDTSKPENIEEAVEFWRRLAAETGLLFRVYEPAGKPIVVITWEGTDPNMPSIMLNSHMDVVTVEESYWHYPAFEAHMDEEGNIYGRGAQDTKDISIQYLYAIKRLKEHNIQLKRTIHITLMPDEETGGFNGMVPFLETDEFKALNVGFALDEGMGSNDDDAIITTYQDRRPWQMKFTFRGEGGHGSAMPDGSAMEKATRLIDAVMFHREQQKAIMKSSSPLDFGAYDSINVNIVEGGVAPNIIPATVTVVVDMRLSSSAQSQDIDKMVHQWMATSGNNTELEFLRRVDDSASTAYDDSNPYWMAMQEAADELGVQILPVVCPATSDMLYVRNYGIPAFGFAPKFNTKVRIHGADEYLNVHTFIRGIDVYTTVIERVANVL